MGTCNNQHESNNTMMTTRGCTRKMGVDVAPPTANSGETAGNPPKKKRPLDPLFAVPSDGNAVGEKITELNSQGISRYQQGDFGTASALFRKAVSLRMDTPFDVLAMPEMKKQKHGDNESVSICGCGVPPPSSYIYQRMDFDEGMNVYADAVPVQADDHPQVVEATLLFNAGQARRKLNDMEEASQFYNRALKTFLSTSRETKVSSTRTVHPIIIPICHNLGQLAYRNGKLREAITFYELALRHSREIHGNDDISTGFSLNCLGVLYYHLSTDKSDSAKSCFEEALRIQDQVLGEDSLESATTHNNVGRVLVQKEEFTAALVHYEKALKIRKRLGPDHIDYAGKFIVERQPLERVKHLLWDHF
jgi:tetratricopeptide (TPR) repeat protein